MKNSNGDGNESVKKIKIIVIVSLIYFGLSHSNYMSTFFQSTWVDNSTVELYIGE